MGLFARQKKTESTLKGHLRELRNRVIICIAVLIFFGTAMFFCYEPILKLLSNTLGAPLYYSDPSGGFSFIMRICLTGGFIFTMPVIIYNIVMFIRPAYELFLTTRRIIIIAISSTILAISGAAFGFFGILPETIAFFNEFQVSGLSALISADQYLNFVTSIVTVFVIVFQVPLVMGIIDSVKSISLKSMLKMEKWVVIVSIIVAIITPFNYDILSSLMVAIPIIGLYNLSIIIILIRHKSKKYQNNLRVYSTIVKPDKNRLNTDLVIDDSFVAEIKNQPKQPNSHTSPSTINQPQTTKIPTVKMNYNLNKKPIRNIDGIRPAIKNKPITPKQNPKVFSDFVRKK